ncbi:hypothetical protein B0T25DRAFT_540520 [Lasiosphaeria hispida]|uniref:Uncharacterized protein n=1 Tax=Lasiosphaeria hispida TaxID=260671 RepID=A0AAJ0HNC1_9PEZI|nr:hypothetical protein B0T25DRAFT_540520 [Lasiosphaeria hispida]
MVNTATDPRVSSVYATLRVRGNITKEQFLTLLDVYPTVWHAGPSLRKYLIDWFKDNPKNAREWLPDILKASPLFLDNPIKAVFGLEDTPTSRIHVLPGNLKPGQKLPKSDHFGGKAPEEVWLGHITEAKLHFDHIRGWLGDTARVLEDDDPLAPTLLTTKDAIPDFSDKVRTVQDYIDGIKKQQRELEELENRKRKRSMVPSLLQYIGANTAEEDHDDMPISRRPRKKRARDPSELHASPPQDEVTVALIPANTTRTTSKFESIQAPRASKNGSQKASPRTQAQAQEKPDSVSSIMHGQNPLKKLFEARKHTSSRYPSRHHENYHSESYDMSFSSSSFSDDEDYDKGASFQKNRNQDRRGPSPFLSHTKENINTSARGQNTARPRHEIELGEARRASPVTLNNGQNPEPDTTGDKHSSNPFSGMDSI